MTGTSLASTTLRSAPLRALIATAVLSMAGCGGGGESPSAGAGAAGPISPTPGQSVQVPGSSQQVETRIGETTVYAVAMPTAAIPTEVAAEHGIERRPDLVMLRISGRRGDVGNLVSVPLKVQATSTDLRGQQQTLELKEVLANGLVDYVGTVDADIPDTLRFDIRVTTPEGATEAMQLTREVQPGTGPAS
jgi:hypothetical protein